VRLQHRRKTASGPGPFDARRGRAPYSRTANFDKLAALRAGAGGEIQLTDGIEALTKEGRVLAYRYAGSRYDCGSKLEYLQAAAVMGLRHPETAAGFAEFLKDLQLR